MVANPLAHPAVPKLVLLAERAWTRLVSIRHTWSAPLRGGARADRAGGVRESPRRSTRRRDRRNAAADHRRLRVVRAAAQRPKTQRLPIVMIARAKSRRDERYSTPPPPQPPPPQRAAPVLLATRRRARRGRAVGAASRQAQAACLQYPSPEPSHQRGHRASSVDSRDRRRR